VILAGATFAAIVVRAVTTVDTYWDTLAYHWPFAARVAGLCDRDCFLLTSGMEAYYDGFPLLLHAAQGLLWRATGTPGMADLINIAMLIALGAYLRWRFAVPLAWSWLAFLAIPEVQIQLTSTYIDVPANAAITLGILVAFRMLTQPEADQRADALIAWAALGIAANSRYQLVAVAVLVWLAIVALALRDPTRLGFDRRASLFAVLGVAGVGTLLTKLAINAAMFGNPFYPIDVVFGPLHFAGSIAMLQSNTVSDVWADSPRALRWVASVLEFDAYRGRPLPWMIGQGDVAQSSPSFRMGGYFVPYVLGALALMAWSARGSTFARRGLATMVALSLLCSMLPASHELRYYMFWMLSLVSILLALVSAPAFASGTQASERRHVEALVAIAAISVILMTGAAYLRASGDTVESLLRNTEAKMREFADGSTICIEGGQRTAFLYASLFHPPRHYRVHMLGKGDIDTSCTVRLALDD
jgi:hypothetical protein